MSSPSFFKLLKIGLLLVLLLSLAGCSSLVKSEQELQTNTSLLTQGVRLGQTFVADFDGLTGLDIYLAPQAPGDGQVTLHLRRDPASQTDLAVAHLPIRTVTAAGTYRFDFNPQSDTRRQYLYIFLEIQGEGSLEVGITSGSAYLDGALQVNHQPFDAQTTFSLVYNPYMAAKDLFLQSLVWAGIVLAGVFLFVLPGWAILKLLWEGWQELNWGEKTGLAAGLSLAVYPLLFLWTDLIGLHLGVLYAWLPGAAALVVILWIDRLSILRIFSPLKYQPKMGERNFLHGWLPDLALITLIILIFGVRFWVIRNLDAPLWGDSYQHTMIVQLMLDHGGLFDSWEPYADLDSFTYHYGFHSAATVLGWLTRLPAARAVLWAGQLLNGLSVLVIYPLAVRLGGNKWAGVSGVLLAGLLLPMPMTYVNWGRYPQLAGQIILPSIIYMLCGVLSSQKRDCKVLTVMWIAIAGLALTHYRVLIFALLFIPVYFVLHVRLVDLTSVIRRTFWMGLGALILFAPWFFNVYGGKVLTIFQSQITTPAQSLSSSVDQYNSIGDLFIYLPAWMWLCLPVIASWGLWQRRKEVAYIILWLLLALVAANPDWINLPGTGTLSNFAFFILIYIPSGVLGGAALGWVWQAIDTSKGISSRIAVVGISIFCMGLGVIGVSPRVRDVDIHTHTLVTRPDVRASAWIKENTPLDSRFVVNYFFAYMGTLVVGSDGGWWLPLLAERQTNLPPLTYGIENGSSSDYYQGTNALAQEIIDRGITDLQIIHQLKENGFTHIYIGQRQGQVNNPGQPVLDPQILLKDNRFQLIYQQDRVWIFKIVP